MVHHAYITVGLREPALIGIETPLDGADTAAAKEATGPVRVNRSATAVDNSLESGNFAFAPCQ